MDSKWVEGLEVVLNTDCFTDKRTLLKEYINSWKDGFITVLKYCSNNEIKEFISLKQNEIKCYNPKYKKNIMDVEHTINLSSDCTTCKSDIIDIVDKPVIVDKKSD
jgi:hypothetical protein